MYIRMDFLLLRREGGVVVWSALISVGKKAKRARRLLPEVLLYSPYSLKPGFKKLVKRLLDGMMSQ